MSKLPIFEFFYRKNLVYKNVFLLFQLLTKSDRFFLPNKTLGE